jgi:serine/threonine protein kinase
MLLKFIVWKKLHMPSMCFVTNPSILYLKQNCLVGIAETDQGIFKAVLKSKLDLSPDVWDNISDGAKDLVKKMLNPDPSKRLTAYQVLCKCYDLDLWLVL